VITVAFDPETHDRVSFDCGIVEINSFLRQRARQFTKKGLATCWILEGDTESDVSGFYTLSATSVTAEVAKVAVTRGLPSEIPIPAVLIGQLAVDQRFQGQGKGSLLLIDALKRSKELGLGWAVVVVDAFDEKAAQWYETFGFIRISSKPTRLIIPRITVEKLP